MEADGPLTASPRQCALAFSNGEFLMSCRGNCSTGTAPEIIAGGRMLFRSSAKV